MDMEIDRSILFSIFAIQSSIVCSTLWHGVSEKVIVTLRRLLAMGLLLEAIAHVIEERNR